MSKAVLLSVQPKWCEKICHKIGEKTDGSPIYEKRVEVRKTRPKLDTPFPVYIYQTKKTWVYNIFSKIADWQGKVIGEFVCDKIYQYSTSDLEGQTISDEKMQKLSCLTKKELSDYEYSAPPRDYCIYLIGLYGWHISNLVIYDKPKELSEFIYPTACDSHIAKHMMCNTCCLSAKFCSKKPKMITRPPQSWCYVEELSK